MSCQYCISYNAADSGGVPEEETSKRDGDRDNPCCLRSCGGLDGGELGDLVGGAELAASDLNALFGLHNVVLLVVVLHVGHLGQEVMRVDK